MKKWICFGCCLLLVLLSGCTSPVQEKTISVVATIFPYYDIARQVGGTGATVTMLLSPGGEVHGYEPTLQDLALIEQCDVFLYNGGGDDGWVEELLSNCDTSQKQVIRLMDHVELLAVGEEEHHSQHHHTHEEADEHIFTTPENGLLIANAITMGMKKASAQNQELFEKNYKQLAQEFTQLQQDYLQLQGAKKQMVIADRFPFLYLTTAYSLSYVAAFSGCTANGEGDLKTLYKLKNAATKENNSKVILCTEFSNQALANALADAVGGKVKRLHSCHNVTKEEWKQQVTYAELLHQNLEVLKEVLDL